MERLWHPVSLGRMTLPNRLAMAPTRSRSTASGTPTELNAEYYAQRASFGLIVSEGTQPSDDGRTGRAKGVRGGSGGRHEFT
jgi:N-ethylmaleimide reductase